MPVVWNTVVSSNINMVGYEKETQDLHIIFRSGAEYIYSRVPESVYQEFMSADSKGSFFHSRIKGVYEYTKEV